MDNYEYIKNLTSRLRSCITCDELHCPAIRKRLEHHINSHHSTSSHAPTDQNFVPKRSSLKSFDNPLYNPEEQSTSDADRGKKSQRSSYKNALEKEVRDWSEDLPKYLNPSAESKKQNITNALIEKIDKLKPEIKEDYYDTKLFNHISKLVDSLPPCPILMKGDPVLNELKRNLVDRINKLNRKMINKKSSSDSDSDRAKGSRDRKKPKNKSNSANVKDKTGETKRRKQKNSGTSTSPCCSSDRCKANPTKDRKSRNTNIVDKNDTEAQVQHDVSNMRPYYSRIYDLSNSRCSGRHIMEEQSPDIDEFAVKGKLGTWLQRVVAKSGRDIDENDGKVMIEVLFNRLSPLLKKPMNSQKYKTHLKEEILNFLNDYFKDAVDNNGIYYRKIIESLTVTLLLEIRTNVAHSTRNNKYSYYCTARQILNSRNSWYYKLIFTSIIKDALDSVDIISESLENNITRTLLQNIEHIRDSYHDDDDDVNHHQVLKEDLYILLKSSTNLSNHAIANIINIILNKLLYILCDDCDKIHKDNIPPWSQNILCAYKSELELCEPPKYSMSYLQPYFNLTYKDASELNTREKIYKERIYILVAAWVKSLPIEHRKAEDINTEERIIKTLTNEILHQVKLQAGPLETSLQREMFFSFFLNKWLNSCEYFYDIKNVKPYIDKLISKLINIPVQGISNKQIQSNNEFTVMTTYPQAIHISNNSIEDEISKIINRQPSYIFIITNKHIRDRQVNEFSLKVQNSLVENIATKHLMKDIVLWLKTMIKPEETEYFNLLKEQLLNSLNRSRTSDYSNNDTMTDTMKYEETKDVRNEILTSSPCYETINNNGYDPEKQLKEIISLYIGRIYDTGNSIDREIFDRIFKTELQKFIANGTRLNYEYFHDNEQSFIILARQLKYINIISDWLRELPLTTPFNRLGNRSRIEILINLAKNIDELKVNKLDNLNGIEYKVYLASTINKYADLLPISAYDKRNIFTMITNLIFKIEHDRRSFSYENFNLNNNVFPKTHDEQLSGFIAKYVRDNCREFSDDDLKIEALSARLFKEITKLTENRPQNQLSDLVEADQIIWADDPVRRFNFELCYAKNISDCLNNLSLLPITDETSMKTSVKMINDLADRMYERWLDKNYDSTNIYVDSDLSDYIKLWITEFPLDTSSEIDEFVVLEQLLKRMEIVNKSKLEKHVIHNETSEMCYVNTCCNLQVINERRQDPGTAIVEAIERWCTELPLEIENENVCTAMRDNVAKELYKKVSELNVDPKCFINNNVYQELLSDEIDAQLGNLPQNSKLQSMTKNLKRQLIFSIMENRIQMREQASSTEYKNELEKVIGLSLPNPLQEYQEETAGYKIYKDRLATLFILENFDHGYDDFKENYQRRIKKEIDKYSIEAQNRNTIPLSKDQAYNELYSALFNVPLPNESSISEEVEEIKTRCEIDSWFETLPLIEPTCTGEIFTRNQISAMLAKRLHRMEKYERNSDNAIQKEIMKWLSKFSFMPGQENNFDQFARKLLERLKSTSQQRQCTQRKEGGHGGEIIKCNNKSLCKENLYTSQTTPYFKISYFPATNPGDLIFNIVESWCHQLNLPAKTPQEYDNMKVLTDSLVTKIVMKISELNVNYEIWNNDLLYDALLDDALENLLSNLPTSYEFNKTKQFRKNQLKEAIKSVKPFIKKEKARYEYKQELQNVVGKFLNEPKNSELRDLYDNLKDNIVDNFIMYSYSKYDEGGGLYKMMVNIAVDKYFTEVNESKDIPHDPMMIGNHLLCEMAKIAAPSENAILDEIREIRIKFEINDFFNNEILCARKDMLPLRNHVIASLAKRISGVANQSFLPYSHYKIKNEIIKCLRKLDKNVIPEKVDILTEKILNIPDTKIYCESEYASVIDKHMYDQRNQTREQQNNSMYKRNNQTSDDGLTEWMSLLSVTPTPNHNVDDEGNMTTLDRQKLNDIPKSHCSREGEGINDSKIGNSDLTKGIVLPPSLREDQERNNLTLAEHKRPNNSNDRAKLIMPSDSDTDEPKLNSLFLSNQDSELVQNISLQQSSSLNKPNRTVKNQQNTPSEAFIDQQPAEERQENQKTNEFPSSPQANRTREYPRFIQNQNIQQLENKATNLTQNHIQTSAKPFSEQQDSTEEKNIPSSLQPRNLEREISNLSSIQQNLTTQHGDVNKPNPPESSSSNLQPTISKNTFASKQCGKRRPSISFLNSNQTSNSTNVQYSQCSENKGCLCKKSLTSDKDIENSCQCGCKSNSVGKNDIPLCRLHKKKHCRTCNNLNQLYCNMSPCRYPRFYFY